MVAHSRCYGILEQRWASGGVVILDGAIGSELQQRGYPPAGVSNISFGVFALYDAPDLVRDVHRDYARAGADVLTTNTWVLNRAVQAESDGSLPAPTGAWREKARLAVRLAREGAAVAGRDDCAVAFSLGVGSLRDAGSVYRSLSLDYVRALIAALEGEPPDLFLVETMEDIPASLEFPEYEALVATGLPVWIAYRRTVGHRVTVGGDLLESDGDLFGRAARRFEELGAGAVLVNCLPPTSVEGVLPWLRQFTSLPVGAYANLGRWYPEKRHWSYATVETPTEYLAHARQWVRDGAKIVGGCCGTGPSHIRALAREFGRPAPAR